jgi:hypothetical protein
LVTVIKSKFELTEKNSDDILTYEREVKEVYDIIEHAQITFNSPAFKGKEKESYTSKYIQGVLKEASEMVAKIPLLPGYTKYTTLKHGLEDKPEEELKHDSIKDAVTSSSSSIAKKLFTTG